MTSLQKRQGGEEPRGGRDQQGLPQAWPACDLSSGPDSQGRRPAVEGLGPMPMGAGGQRLEPVDILAHCGQLLHLLSRVPGPICEPRSLWGNWGSWAGWVWPGAFFRAGLPSRFSSTQPQSPSPPGTASNCPSFSHSLVQSFNKCPRFFLRGERKFEHWSL